MVDQQIVDYIKRQLDHGVEKEKVRNFLISNGWQASVIEEAFNFIESNNPNPNVTATAMNNVVNNYDKETDNIPEEKTEDVTEKKPKKIILIIVIILGVILLLAGSAFAYLYFSKSPILDKLLNKNNVQENTENVKQEDTQNSSENNVNEPTVDENNNATDEENPVIQPIVENETATDNGEYGYAYGADNTVTKPDMTLDSDNDGLTDAEEEVYGTDKNNSDTDGDGYTDGAEVQNGYNPLGEGKLTK